MLGLSRAGLERGGVLNTPGLVGEPLLDVVHQCLQTSRRLPCKLLATAATCLQLNSHRETFGAALYPTTRPSNRQPSSVFQKFFFFACQFSFSLAQKLHIVIMWFYIMHYITVCSTVCFTEMMLHFVGYSIWLWDF